MISLICPSRGRASLCHRMVQSAFGTSTQGNVEIILGTVEHYNNIHNVTQVQVPEWPTVQSWNHLAKTAKGNLIMLASDDMIFATPHWDEALLDHYNSLEDKIHVYALQDSRDPDGTPHIIVTREYMDTMGYFVCPIFLHWFIDSWTVAIAKANNCFTHLRDYSLIHDKPSDQGKPDETHSRIRRMGWHERDQYVNNTCQHFLKYEQERLMQHMRRENLARYCAFCGKNNKEVVKITRGPASQICNECVDYIKAGGQ